MPPIRRLATAFLAATLTASAGCANNGTQEQGGILGSDVGHGRGNVAAIIVGTLAGAALGGAIGRSMDETDRLRTAMALENVRTGVPSTWRNPDTGYRYEVTPTRTYETTSGPCREFTLDAQIGGATESVYGTACRQPDGS